MKILNYIKELINKGSESSSKRFIALYSMLLITFIVIRYTSPENVKTILITMCSFVTALAGVSTFDTKK